MKKISIIATVLWLILSGVIMANAEEYITGYDVNNGCAAVKVEKGVYAPGISMNKCEASFGASLPRSVTLIDDSTATTTSSAISLKGVKKATLFLSTDIPTSGKATTTFAVTVSGDDSTFTTYNKLIDNVTNTNAQNITRVASKAYDATSTAAIVSLDLENDVFTSFKVSATQIYTSGGILSGATVKALLEY